MRRMLVASVVVLVAGVVVSLAAGSGSAASAGRVVQGGGSGRGQEGQVGTLTELAGKAGCVTSRRVAGCAGMVGVLGTGLEGSALLVSADGRWLYATGHGSLAVLERNPKGGRLSRPVGITPCVQDPGTSWYEKGCLPIPAFWPSSLGLGADGRALYVASAATDYGGDKSDEWTRLDVLRRDPVSGSLRRLRATGGCFRNPKQTTMPVPKSCAPARGLDLPTALVLSPDGRNVYVGSSGGIAVFAPLDSGALRQLPGAAGCLLARDGAQSCSARPPGTGRTFALEVSRDGRNAYALLEGNLRKEPYPPIVLALARDPRGGVLARLAGKTGCLSGEARSGCRVVSGLVSPWWDTTMALAPDGRDLYVATGRAILTLRRNRDGSLTPHPGATALRRSPDRNPSTRDIAISPDGRNLYLVSSDYLLSYTRDPGSGDLSAPHCFAPRERPGCERARLASGGLAAVTVTPDGQNVYVLGSDGQYPGTTRLTAFHRRTSN